MQSRIKFFGSVEDLAALRSELIASGIKEHEDNVVRASENEIKNMVNSQVLSGISFVIIKGIGSAVKHYLTTRGKRMVTRETHGEKITIKGDFTVDEIERLLKIPYGLDIEDDVEPSPEPSNKESEMGFHVGMKKPEQIMDAYGDPTPIATVEQFKAALRAVRDRYGISDKELAMLRAHCRAPNHTISTFQLAKELGYASHGDVNKSYGKFAHDICDALHCVLPPTPSGDPHWWRTLAYGNHGVLQSDGGHYEWIMRPELVQTLQEWKWV